MLLTQLFGDTEGQKLLENLDKMSPQQKEQFWSDVASQMTNNDGGQSIKEYIKNTLSS